LCTAQVGQRLGALEIVCLHVVHDGLRIHHDLRGRSLSRCKEGTVGPGGSWVGKVVRWTCKEGMGGGISRNMSRD
jgi:hypothetical protein